MKLRIFRALTLVLVMSITLSVASGVRAQSAKDLLKVPIAAAPSFKKRALVVGIENYEQPIAKLTVCNDDARAFAAYLRQDMGFSGDAITLLTDDAPLDQQKPTFTRLVRAVDAFIESVQPDDEVVFFFSGHGVRDNNQDYLVPLDGSSNNVARTCVSYDELRNRLETKSPRRCLLITDACRSLRGGKSLGDRSSFGAGTVDSPPQFVELRSCLPLQVSHEMTDQKSSVFTYYLLQGLRGDREAAQNGVITFDSLFLFVRGKVSQYTSNRIGEPQTPDGRVSPGSGVMALARPGDGPSPYAIAEANRALAQALQMPYAEENQRQARWLAIEKSLEAGANSWNLKAPPGASLLHFAAGRDTSGVWVKRLLDAGLDVNAKADDGITPLHNAVYGANEVGLRLLLERGARVNEKNKDGATPLHGAVYGGNEAIVRLLLGAGALVNEKDNNNLDAIAYAADKSNLEIIRLLIARGGDLLQTDKEGFTRLHGYAPVTNFDASVQITALIKAGIPVDIKTKDGSTPLMLAANAGATQNLKTLLALGAGVNEKDKNLATPLHYAAASKSDAIARLLLDAGALVNAKDNDGNDAIVAAADAGNVEMIRLLATRGGDLLQKEENGSTRLHGYARVTDFDASVFITTLIKAGIPVDIKTKDGTTPLMLAVIEGATKNVVTLLNLGANINAQDANGWTPLHLAAEIATPDLAQTLLTKGANMEAKNGDQLTPLHIAAANGKLEMIRFLVGKGAKINALDKNGWTPLVFAEKERQVAAARLLISLGAKH